MIRCNIYRMLDLLWWFFFLLMDKGWGIFFGSCWKLFPYRVYCLPNYNTVVRFIRNCKKLSKYIISIYSIFWNSKDYIKGAFFQLDQPRLVVSINIHVRHIGTFIFYYKCQLKYLRLGHRDFKTPGKKLLWISVLIIPF